VHKIIPGIHFSLPSVANNDNNNIIYYKYELKTIAIIRDIVMPERQNPRDDLIPFNE